MDLPTIIQKEALYCAVGRCAIRLKDAIPFNQWLETSLVAEAQETNQRYIYKLKEAIFALADVQSRYLATPLSSGE